MNIEMKPPLEFTPIILETFSSHDRKLDLHFRL